MSRILSNGDEILVPEPLPVGSIGTHASGWWGMMMLILTEASLFGYLLFSYYYFAVDYGRDWLPEELPGFRLSGPGTAILILSSVAVWLGEKGAKRNSKPMLVGGLVVGWILGAIFVGLQVKEWSDKPFSIATDSYGSLYFTVTGFHMAHVIAGLIILAALTLWSAMGYFNRWRMAPISIGAIYWHFVDVVWLGVFFTFYVTPHLGL